MADFKKWEDRINRAKVAFRPFRDQAQRFKNGYRGVPLKGFGRDFRFTIPQQDRFMQVNFFYQTVETIMPAIFGGNPKVFVEPKNELTAKVSAKKLQENVNYWFRELDSEQEFTDALFDSFFGMSAIQVGWDYEEVEIEKIADRPLELIDGRKIKKGQKFKTQVVVRDQPFLKWIDVHAGDLLVDPDVKRRRQARWMATREIIPYQEFLQLDKIPNKLKKMVKPQMRAEDMDPENSRMGRFGQSDFFNPDSTNSDKEWVNLWVIWDKQNKRRRVMTDGVNEFLIDEPWPYHFEVKDDPFPITILDAKQDPFGPYSFSEFFPIEGQIDERDRLRTVQAEIVKRLAPRLVYSEGTATRAQINAFLKSSPSSATKLNNPAGLVNAPMPNIPPDFFNWEAVLSEDLKNISGLSEFEQGVLARTATEASIAEGRANIRRSKRSQLFEQFVATVGAKIAGLLQQYQSETQAIRIQGQQGTEFLQVNKRDIQGEFDFSIEPGIMEHKNETLRRRELMRFAEVAVSSPVVSQSKLWAELAKAHDINPEEILMSPEEQQALQQEPEPTVKFSTIPLEDLDPVSKRQVVEEAKRQNNVSSLPENPQIQDLIQGLNQGGFVTDNDNRFLPGSAQIPQVDPDPISKDPDR